MLRQIATVNDSIINSPRCQISRDQIDKRYLRWWIPTKKWHPFKETILSPYTHKVFHAFLKAFKLDNNPGNYFPIALSYMYHNETRNKLDQRFVYNVETNFEIFFFYKWQRCSLRKIVIPIEIKSFLDPTMIQTMNQTTQFKNENRRFLHNNIPDEIHPYIADNAYIMTCKFECTFYTVYSGKKS